MTTIEGESEVRDGWLPIDDVPRDQDVLVKTPRGHVRRGKVRAGDAVFTDHLTGERRVRFTGTFALAWRPVESTAGA